MKGFLILTLHQMLDLSGDQIKKGWAGRVARAGFWWGDLKTWHRCEDNVKMDLQELRGRRGMCWPVSGCRQMLGCC